MTHTQPPAGGVMSAAEALAGDQETFTRAQVAFLIRLAYTTGRRHTLAEDLAETVAGWNAHRTPAQTREQRMAARVTEMEANARAQAEREGRPYRIYLGGPVDWETSLPVRPRHIESVAAA